MAGRNRFMSCRLRQLFFGASVFFMLPVVGCSTTNVFTSYTSKMNLLIDGLTTRQFNHSLKVLNKYRKSNDKILYLMERGRIAQIKNDTDSSMKDFEAAIAAVRQMEEKAVISASDVGAQTTSLLANDNTIPYRGDGYEKVFMYQFQAFNYLAEKDIEGAGVEVRRANREQELALKMHEKELARAEEKARDKKIDTQKAYNNLNSAYQSMDDVAGKVKNSFQNAYTFYMSGIVYELLNQPNDAYIDYKKALQIFPDNAYLQRDVMRLAKDLEMDQEYEDYAYRFGSMPVKGEAGAGDGKTGELVVFFENGLVPQKKEIRIPIPTPNGILAIAFPIYHTKWSEVEPLSLSESWSSGSLGTTESICHAQALAVKSLKEKVPVMVIRHILRAAAKAAIQLKANDSAGSLGQIFSSIYNVVSERADVRSWLTLPRDVQIMRIRLPEGAHRLHLAHKASGASSDIDISMNQNKTILRVIRIRSELYTTSITF